ncbi:class I SAM-dependent methyltransferase [uncultured Draconibacterium sp.]|uniref:class I SAM-dependent methyltransferase n=1 Tax=uncultured Draconibacterium sp. TaxID=1573823 RepID=UPI0032179AEC
MMENNLDRKNHWEKIYQTKSATDVSWFQSRPSVSLEFIEEFAIPKSEKIIDVGGGDSLLVDYLLELGYQDITVLDISEMALEKAKLRLGEKAARVNWIVADAATFQPTEKYGFWHDRAAFHFLTNEDEIQNYIATIQQNLKPEGVLVIGTFSTNGPTSCSGIEIKQYSETSMSDRLKQFFKKIRCIITDHKTPSESIQQFIFCSFKRLAI